MNKAVVTVAGKDTVGIIAKTCAYLAEANVNILEISQTVVGGLFHMMMIADYEKATKDFETMACDLEAIGEDIGVQIRCQREEIFTMMHRV